MKQLLNVNKINYSSIHHSQPPIFISDNYFLHIVPHNKFRQLEIAIENPYYDYFHEGN